MVQTFKQWLPGALEIRSGSGWSLATSENPGCTQIEPQASASVLTEPADFRTANRK